MSKVVYRVQNLPSGWAEEDLESLIQENLKDDEKDPTIISRIRIIPSCNSSDPPRPSALVIFEKTPHFLQHLTQSTSDYHSIEVTEDDDVSFDRHFHGFTQLYSTSPPGVEVTAEYV